MTLNRPWSNIGTAHRVIMANISGKLFVNPTRGSKDKERTQNTVMQRLILNFDLDLQLTLVKYKHCTSSHYSWHVCKVICKYHQGFKRYRADTKCSHTMLKELEHRNLGWKVLILKYDLGKSLSKEMWCKMADTKKFFYYIF